MTDLIDTPEAEFDSEDGLAMEELLRHLEIGFWTAVVLIPVLHWFSGTAVSTDQFVMRTILCVTGYVGAPITTRWRRRHRTSCSEEANF